MRIQQKEKRKLEIIIAAIDVFVLKGYSGTKIQDIATSANMSVGLLFHYFKSKEELYCELLKIAVDGTLLPFALYYDSIPDFFIKFTMHLFDLIKKQPYRAKIFALLILSRRNNDIPLSAKNLVQNDDTILKLTRYIQKGQDDGQIVEGDPFVLATLYWNTVQSSIEYYVYNPKIPLPKSEWIVGLLRKHTDAIGVEGTIFGEEGGFNV